MEKQGQFPWKSGAHWYCPAMLGGDSCSRAGTVRPFDSAMQDTEVAQGSPQAVEPRYGLFICCAALSVARTSVPEKWELFDSAM